MVDRGVEDGGEKWAGGEGVGEGERAGGEDGGEGGERRVGKVRGIVRQRYKTKERGMGSEEMGMMRRRERGVRGVDGG